MKTIGTTNATALDAWLHQWAVAHPVALTFIGVVAMCLLAMWLVKTIF